MIWLNIERASKYWLLVPLIIFVVGLIGFPFLYDLYLSFHDISLETLQAATSQFVGMKNFQSVLADSTFWESLFFSFKFGLAATAIEVLLGLALALYFYRYFQKRDWVITFVLIPMMIAPALFGIMLRLMLNQFVGIIPKYLSLVGLGNINLLGTHWVFVTLIASESLQWTPFAFLIIYAGLQTLPEELFEAARIDGANYLKIFRYITLPLLTPALAIAAFIRFVDSFRIFDLIYVLTGGGPGTLTTSISIYIYRTAFKFGSLGKSVTASLFLLLLSFIPLLIAMKFVLKGSLSER